MILMGVVLVGGSILSVLAGRLMDKVSKFKSLIVWTLIFILGLILVFFATKGALVYTMIAGIIMIFGYIVSGVAINASLREFTPNGK